MRSTLELIFQLFLFFRENAETGLNSFLLPTSILFFHVNICAPCEMSFNALFLMLQPWNSRQILKETYFEAVLQGDPNQNLKCLLAITLKLCISDPMMLKPKCVWDAYNYFWFSAVSLQFSAVCLQFFKRILALPTGVRNA